MEIFQDSFSVSSNRRCQMVDITAEVQSVIQKSGIRNGEATVYTPHTTAAITINENADPDVMHDILLTLEETFPKNRSGYKHNEGNSDSHVKSSLVGCSEHVLISGTRLSLGTWQGIFFCEFDGPRSRKVFVQVRGQ